MSTFDSLDEKTFNSLIDKTKSDIYEYGFDSTAGRIRANDLLAKLKIIEEKGFENIKLDQDQSSNITDFTSKAPMTWKQLTEMLLNLQKGGKRKYRTIKRRYRIKKAQKLKPKGKKTRRR
jgi:Glu-tRNA(Gln) amidotransferase subunit E-like FAD-binding protein